MRPQLDVPAQRIVCGDREWRFEVDCRDDSVSLELNGTPYRMRPLRWREKRALARFAGLGEAFLKGEFVRVSLADPGTIPRNREEADVLFELARWFNAPDENAPLPFDPATLAKVTFALCRAMGLAPENFDPRAANEVELLWAALQSETPAAGDDVSLAAVARRFAGGVESTETTKIVVVPDPVVSGVDDAEPELAASGEPTVDSDHSAAFPDEAARNRVEANPPQRPEQRGPERFRVTRVAPGESSELPQWKSERLSVPQQTSLEPPRVEEHEDMEQALGKTVRTVAEDDLPLPLGAAPSAHTGIRPPAVPAEAASRAGVPSLKVDSRTLLATLPRGVREQNLGVSVSGRPAESPVLESLAEELSRAAAQMGIDVET